MGLFSNLFNGGVRVVRTSSGEWVNSKHGVTYGEVDNLQLALSSDVLTTCINIHANYASKAVFKEYDEKGNEIENSDFVNMLDNPNPFQTKEQFITELVWLLKCYGWVFQRPYNNSISDIPNYLYNLNTSSISFSRELQKKLIYKESDINTLNKTKFQYLDINNTVNIEYGDILPFYDIANGLNQNPFISPSRIDAVKKRVQNVNLFTDAERKFGEDVGREILHKEKEKGQIGVQVRTDEQKDIKRKFSSFNKGIEEKIHITNADLKHKFLHANYKDFGFNEALENNLPLITGVMEVPNELYKVFKQGDTFTNKDAAAVQFIQGVTQPFVDSLAKSWSKKYNRNIKAHLDHLPVLAEIKNKKIDSALKISQTLRNLQQSGYTLEQANRYLEDLGINTVDNE